MGKGYLVVNVSADNVAQPVGCADVHVIGDGVDIHIETDISGNTTTLELDCPDKELSLTPQRTVLPYAEYDIIITKEGLQPERINGIQILDTTHSIENAIIRSEPSENPALTTIEVAKHTLWGNYPPKIVEDPFSHRLMPNGQHVLPEPIVPEFVIVHDGLPTNTNASNYQVDYRDYIKNVASGEIYSTWPTETIRANVLAILSFTQNRIFTEWYRGKGYTFTITSSTQFDQYFSFGRNIYTEISNVVDELFTQFITFPNVPQPFFAQYNDGVKVNNDGWLSQWGSKNLGDQGYSAIQILKYFYGDSIYLDSAEIIEGLPFSFPGYTLQVGICGDAVQKIQLELNVIASSFPAIPTISPADGHFDENTRNTVETFQKIFNLPVTGVIDYSTWFNISHIFISVSNMLRGRYEY